MLSAFHVVSDHFLSMTGPFKLPFLNPLKQLFSLEFPVLYLTFGNLYSGVPLRL